MLLSSIIIHVLNVDISFLFPACATVERHVRAIFKCGYGNFGM